MLDRDQLRVDIRAVRQLVREWDPIGVYLDAEADWPDNEYDSYVPQILAHLRNRGGVKSLAEYLHIVRTETMGLPPNREDDQTFAERAFAWFDTRNSS